MSGIISIDYLRTLRKSNPTLTGLKPKKEAKPGLFLIELVSGLLLLTSMNIAKRVSKSSKLS